MPDKPNLRTIIASWLKSHGYNGLCNLHCGCHIKDLMCCDQPQPDCAPGYLHQCPPDCEECDGRGCIKPEKPRKRKIQGE